MNCPNCTSAKVKRKFTSVLKTPTKNMVQFKCARCHYTWYVTVGLVFEGESYPLTPMGD